MTQASPDPKASPQARPMVDTGFDDADIAVVGAGVVGTACALALVRQGLRVRVLDSDAPGMGASFGNAGHLATEQVFPIADASLLKRIPGMLMDPLGPLRLDWRYLPKAAPWLMRLLWNLRSSPYQRSVSGIRALNEVSLAAWQELLASIGRSDLLCGQGSLLVHEKAETADALAASATRFAAHGVSLERLDGEEVRRRAPGLSERIRGGLFFPDTGHVIDPLQVVKELVRAAEAAGVRFSRAAVQGGWADAGGVRLETNQGRLSVPRVLVAAGAHSASLVAALTGVRVPLDTERGYHLMLPREVERLSMAVTSLERRFIMTPMAEGLRLAGTVEFAGLERPPRMERAWQLRELARGMFARPLDETNATPWMGFRPSLPDSLPVIDRAGPEGRVWLAFGHHHLGLTQAAITARLVSQFISPEREPTKTALPSLAPYRLARFAR
ncbi:NAD(P)/FAD-dependent oxidoreductase [Halomonas caseinilytica]|uniref:D-amino-acid dehydrogenase n=1 Tax=Halomonas caseinilytica TaxID=438744 RepID=A0A1M6UYJ2_9GAMM|nr:FAD-dependent oxidoreductase [Halomonas caseinilytica]SHK74250.1 D-amino-acid dehydrogenase [Halomonas caseinilytica]